MEPSGPPGMSQTSARQRSSSDQQSQGNFMEDLPPSFRSHIPEMVWAAGAKQVKDTFNSYGRIDIFRPYFDVDPLQVRRRLIQSLIPRKPSQMFIANDMYGPSMLILTLVALLLFSMKSNGYVVQDGTLIGTAMLTCIGAWVFISLTISALCYVLSTDISSVHTFSLVGYSFFSHCIVIFLTTVFHPSHSHLFFYSMAIVFCVPACLRLCLYLSSRTQEKSHKLMISGAVFTLLLAFLFYLHFGFHVMMEELGEILGETDFNGSPTPKHSSPTNIEMTSS
ncbi:hypothetical protein AB6A40_006175 [Gnathostoma spinigerum]|uniref:Protein YIPF3 n=1 Tax=Gnathostoma spinigerum TaxID=75299 RepID=A0ABD6EPW0_9BILA